MGDSDSGNRDSDSGYLDSDSYCRTSIIAIATRTTVILTLTAAITTGSLAFSDVFTGALARAAGENVGSYAITQGTLAATGNYAIGTFTGGTLHISAASLTVTADNKSKTYDGAAFTAFTATITGFVNGDTSAVVSGAPAFSGTAVGAVNPGTYTITPAQGSLSAANYDFTTFNPGAGANGPVLGMVFQPSDGKIVIAGDFTAYNNVPRIA